MISGEYSSYKHTHKGEKDALTQMYIITPLK